MRRGAAAPRAGFDAISTAAQEARNPQRDVPIATLGALGVSTGLYVAVGLVLTGLVPYYLLDVPDPIAVAVDAAGAGLSWVRPIVKLGALAGLTSVILVSINGQARIAFAMAADGLLSGRLARVHPRYKTPHNAIALSGCTAAVISAVVPIDVLGEMVSIGTLAAFAFVCVGVIVLRRRRPDARRPFRVPWAPWIPGAGVLMCAAQMVALPLDTWLRLLVWMAAGGVLYRVYSVHHMTPVADRVRRMLGEAAGAQGPGTGLGQTPPSYSTAQ